MVLFSADRLKDRFDFITRTLKSGNNFEVIIPGSASRNWSFQKKWAWDPKNVTGITELRKPYQWLMTGNNIFRVKPQD